ncbi:MAG: efflux RND transporter periplasmic adaptor subunit [Desulfobacterota bacterium]|nr:efflux RND transporter periplasmic adaptor subunit [Thermodesulfobacteriota bacterium]
MLASCQQKTAAPPPRTSEVSTIAVSPRSIVLTTELPGRTSAYRVAEIRPQVNGIILKRLFNEGTEVQAGQVLYQIDPAHFQATLENAKAALGKAEGNRPAIRLRAERLQELIPDKAVSQQEVDDAAAALKQAEADIQFWRAMVTTAQINLGYARITAPVTGRIGKSNVTEGALVTAHQPLPLATIQQLDPIYVDVPQSTSELLRWKRRQQDGRLNPNGARQKKVKLILEDGSVYDREGTLQFRDVTVDPSTGAVTLRVVFPNPEGTLLPGMFVRAVVQEGVQEQAILIPQQAVSRDPKGNPTALIVDGAGQVRQKPLVLDRAIEDQWLVISGLAAGDRVIVEGLQKVRPGAAVKTVPFREAGSAGAAPSPTSPPARPGK